MLFSVVEPRGKPAPVVVEVPHAGLYVDAQTLATLRAPAQAIGRDADLLVDELYQDAPEVGATMLISKASRYVCDLNRSEADIDARAAVSGVATSAPHGLIWHTTTDNQPVLSAPLSPAEVERRLNILYRPYHQALKAQIENKLARFGHCVLLCAHSMPSTARGGSSEVARADIVPGSRGGTTAHRRIIEIPEALARQRHWTVSHDEPYRGGFTTAHYGQPEKGVHAVQVEIARRMYMDESALEKNPGHFEMVRTYCRELVRALGRVFDPA